MTVQPDLPASAESLIVLEQALQDDDADLARRTSHSCVSTPHFDDALSTLARWAPTSDLGVELLIELLDASGTVRRFAGAALLDHSAVDDVSQDALISIAASIGSFQSTGKVTSWVHTIVRHRVVDHLRRQRATVPLEEDQSPAARMSSIIATKASVQQALDSLPELYRRPVVMRDLEGQSYAQIAEILERPLGTVKAQLRRGRAMVAAHLTADQEFLL